MKRLFVMILAAGIGISCASAQRSTLIERKIGHTVFVQDTTKRLLQNRENKISKKRYYSTASMTQPTYDWNQFVFEKVFSKERAGQLTDVILAIRCYIDSIGNVREVVFRPLKNCDKIKLSEFQELEKQFKACKFKIANFIKCEQDGEEGYIAFTIPCYFKRMHKD